MHPQWNWLGIYVLVGDALVLGPYQGKPTSHTVIPLGKGVCGSAVAENRNMRIDDVSKLDNYLACSVQTRSELVVLIKDEERIVGQIDIDSDEIAAFTEADEDFLNRLAAQISQRCRLYGEKLV